MKHLILGASGQIGEELSKTLSKEDIVGTYHSKEPKYISIPTFRLDITDYKAVVSAVQSHKPDVVWLPAAVTHVDKCERDNSAFETNVCGPWNVVQACNQFNKPTIVFFSTDYLFDGKSGPYDEAAISNPLNGYGFQKLRAEHLLGTMYSHFIIIRTCWVYGPESQGKNFVERLVNNLREGKTATIRPEFSCPTYAPDLAKAAFDVLKAFKGKHYKTGLRQVINIAGPDLVSKDEWARDIARKFDCDPELIVTSHVMSHELLNVATRPTLGGLKTDRLKKVIGRQLRNYNECLEEMNVQLSAMRKRSSESQRSPSNPKEPRRI